MKGRDFKITEESQWNRIYQKAVRPYLEAGKVLSVSIGPYTKKRSVSQNSRYWALLTQISQQMPSHMDGQWFAPEAWHDYCKRRFLGVESGPHGNYPKSTRKLSVVEFMGYCDEIEAHFIDQGVMFDVDEAVSF